MTNRKTWFPLQRPLIRSNSSFQPIPKLRPRTWRLNETAAVHFNACWCCGKPLIPGALLAFVATAEVPPRALADEVPNRIRIEYAPPNSEKYQSIADRLKSNRALEKMQEMFGSFRLANDLSLMTRECGMANAWYQRPKVTICYEYVDDIDKGVRKETHDGITHNDAVLGQFIYVVAHEMGHALFDTLNVPLLGRPEDAADEFSTYMMLSFGKQDARRLIHGAAYGYKDYLRNEKVTVPLQAFSDAHGAPMQRFYNLLCIA